MNDSRHISEIAREFLEEVGPNGRTRYENLYAGLLASKRKTIVKAARAELLRRGRADIIRRFDEEHPEGRNG